MNTENKIYKYVKMNRTDQSKKVVFGNDHYLQKSEYALLKIHISEICIIQKLT